MVLDLEDAVTPADKALARDAVAHFLAGVGADAAPQRVVRINDESTPWFDADLAMLAASPAQVVMLPKVEYRASVERVRAACRYLPVLALIESARGVLNAEALAATEGVSRLVFGTLDYALDMGLSGDPLGLDHAASRLALASRAAGLPPPVAGVTPEIGDQVQLLSDLARARAHGFDAKLCIHPSQVIAVHRALRPGDAELDWASRVVAAAEVSSGAVQVDGRMVDRPILERARRLLAQAR